MKPQPLRVLVISQSPATASLLVTMLSGFFVTSVPSIADAEQYLRDSVAVSSSLDFVILDSQSENRADELSRFISSLPFGQLKDTKLVHLYTPTTDSLTGHSTFRTDTPGVVRMTKPPRRARLLQTLVIIKHPNQHVVPSGESSRETADESTSAHRTLYGHVLVAEGEPRYVAFLAFLPADGFTKDNPVAQKLLIKQLERFDLQVVATSNGEEALAGLYC